METELYLPVKAFLEDRGFTVKGEIGGCDMLAISGDEPPVVVICELKQSFNLELILQGVDRATSCDEVWLAARMSLTGKGREGDARFRNLCRRLGIGLLGVTKSGSVELLVSADADAPRRNLKRRSRLMREHQRRVGDPTVGGSTRATIMTAYRQQALVCAALLGDGAAALRDIKSTVPEAGSIVQKNYYGWFERVERGTYRLTGSGIAALVQWPQPQVASITSDRKPSR